MSIQFNDAKELASNYLETQDFELELALIDEETIERDFGWVFFYCAKKYQETLEPKYMIGGNAPIIIDKSNGKITETGTAREIEYYIEEYLKGNLNN